VEPEGSASRAQSRIAGEGRQAMRGECARWKGRRQPSSIPPAAEAGRSACGLVPRSVAYVTNQQRRPRAADDIQMHTTRPLMRKK
jgi:hypothetical protein